MTVNCCCGNGDNVSGGGGCCCCCNGGIGGGINVDIDSAATIVSVFTLDSLSFDCFFDDVADCFADVEIGRR